MKSALDISLSGLIAQRQRMNTIAGNVAHMSTIQDADGNASPFRRRMITFAAETENLDSQASAAGVKFQIELDYKTPFRKVHNPGHKHADKDGYVQYPNINLIIEQINMMEAARAYEANIAAIEMTSEMSDAAYRILG
ncbi:MAG: flagellar basal body rod protein FlgC [Planctomycetes bacterium]|nr:flagellar basal body rod protein FlgC [Planctomycetota bacterium]